MKKDKKVLKEEFMETLRKKYNCSWAQCLYQETLEKDRFGAPALFYRGNTITYEVMFDNALKYARSLKAMGIKKGDRVPVCLNHCPEEIYLLLGLSFIGAVVDSFGEKFDKDYIEERIAKTGSKVLFMTDDKYRDLKDVSRSAGIENIVMFSLTDSYPNHKNPYSELEKEFYHGNNLVPHYAEVDSRIMPGLNFVSVGENYDGKVIEDVTLDDVFTITYSSGSTNSHRPKAIVHKVETYNAMAYAHTCGDVPSIKKLRTLVHIPAHSNTSLVSSISDALFQGYTCALEYIYDEHFFPISLQINKPSQVIATRSHWLRCFKEYESNPKYRNVNLKFLLTPFSVGEPTSPGEEKFINKKLKQYKAGTEFTKVPFVTLGMAGGDCEHSGIFVLPFKAMMDKNPNKVVRKEETGYSTYRMVEVAVLDEDGNHCAPYEHGNLVANSPCTMLEYDDNPDATAEFFITDSDGKTWGSFNLYSYIDRYGKIHLKGRKQKEEDIPPYMLSDIISKDTKNIMSCEVVHVEENAYVAHVELQPDCKKSLTDILASATKRIHTKLKNAPIILYRVHTYRDGFKLTGCGKRDFNSLKAEGVKQTLMVDLNPNFEYVLIDGERYMEIYGKGKTLKMDKLN